jgi:hypothetical protein
LTISTLQIGDTAFREARGYNSTPKLGLLPAEISKSYKKILCIKLLDLHLWYNMKIEYSIAQHSPKFNLQAWLSENEPKLNTVQLKKFGNIHQHYLELVDDFMEFLNSTDGVVDSDGKTLSAIDIYNAIEYFKIRIQKLWLLFNLKLYKTHNVNKDTQVRYIVMRAFWIDDSGKPFRKFSKNLGAENKVLVKGKIPVSVYESVEDYILTLMWDLYYFEYISDDEAGYDEEGNIIIVKD